jgi:hypothetical protein
LTFLPNFSDLPLETWTDIFRFLDRSQLVALVPHFGEVSVAFNC